MLPILFGSILALSKVVDYWHHWYDVLVGAIIGTVFAVLSYRAVYWSVWDWRYNHIPLPYYFADTGLPSRPLPYAHPPPNPSASTTTPQPDPIYRKLTAINFAGWQNRHSPSFRSPDRSDLSSGPNQNQQHPASHLDGVQDLQLPPPSGFSLLDSLHNRRSTIQLVPDMQFEHSSPAELMQMQIEAEREGLEDKRKRLEIERMGSVETARSVSRRDVRRDGDEVEGHHGNGSGSGNRYGNENDNRDGNGADSASASGSGVPQRGPSINFSRRTLSSGTVRRNPDDSWWSVRRTH
ncbi:hypothetical protein K491DRAFT_170403 [Lophiostoma macrostomum CBS 122681]|uniref:Phosphatidic acid phosphatase type 2/haloperoxidase domain-containing protein n=1 Tax=Lophiostoma macrostomum CBS 122681 TaxID=1314788 RepID=A0A6A6SS17_9PLEO|nr:hypothetical protein K491DRAFT_170403 [Lophiostoma macrostomum CBS 122681]